MSLPQPYAPSTQAMMNQLPDWHAGRARAESRLHQLVNAVVGVPTSNVEQFELPNAVGLSWPTTARLDAPSQGVAYDISQFRSQSLSGITPSPNQLRNSDFMRWSNPFVPPDGWHVTVKNSTNDDQVNRTCVKVGSTSMSGGRRLQLMPSLSNETFDQLLFTQTVQLAARNMVLSAYCSAPVGPAGQEVALYVAPVGQTAVIQTVGLLTQDRGQVLISMPIDVAARFPGWRGGEAEVGVRLIGNQSVGNFLVLTMFQLEYGASPNAWAPSDGDDVGVAGLRPGRLTCTILKSQGAGGQAPAGRSVAVDQTTIAAGELLPTRVAVYSL